MFRDNVRLANKLAYKAPVPYDPALDKDDLIQEAYIGLWLACQRFKSDLGYAFSTYAVPTIQGQIYRLMRDTGTFKEPRSWKNIRFLIKKYDMTLPLSESDIDILLSDEGHKVSRAAILQFSVMSGTVYLDEPISNNDGDSVTMLDRLPDTSTNAETVKLSDDQIEQIIDTIIEHIDDTHRELVEEWMYATLEGCRVTQATLGKKYNLSQAHVSRILNQVPQILKAYDEEIKSLFGV